MNLPGYTAEEALRQTTDVYYGASTFGNWSSSGKALFMRGNFLSPPLGVLTPFRPRSSRLNFSAFVGDRAIDRLGIVSPLRFAIGPVGRGRLQVGPLIGQVRQGELGPCQSPVTFTCNTFGCDGGGICCLTGPSTNFPSCRDERICKPGFPGFGC